jgi:hypothetical protein
MSSELRRANSTCSGYTRDKGADIDPPSDS